MPDADPYPREPWLRGVLPEFDPVVGHLIRAVAHIREDLRRALDPLRSEDIWAKPHGMTSAGFHAKHLAGSTRRLCAYLEGRGLTEEEVAAIETESIGSEGADELIRWVDIALENYERQLSALSPENFGVVRFVGRARFPVTAIGLAIHIAEHGQRHVGQAICAAKLARAVRNG
jgi:hypothetical protein